MRTVDKWPGYDDWLLRDLPDDELPLTEDEARREREDERDQRTLDQMFRW